MSDPRHEQIGNFNPVKRELDRLALLIGERDREIAKVQQAEFQSYLGERDKEIAKVQQTELRKFREVAASLADSTSADLEAMLRQEMLALGKRYVLKPILTIALAALTAAGAYLANLPPPVVEVPTPVVELPAERIDEGEKLLLRLDAAIAAQEAANAAAKEILLQIQSNQPQPKRK